MGYLAASLTCIAGITDLASQSTARVGNALGIMGISTGVLTALCSLNFPAPLLTQALVLLGAGEWLMFISDSVWQLMNYHRKLPLSMRWLVWQQWPLLWDLIGSPC